MALVLQHQSTEIFGNNDFNIEDEEEESFGHETSSPQVDADSMDMTSHSCPSLEEAVDGDTDMDIALKECLEDSASTDEFIADADPGSQEEKGENDEDENNRGALAVSPTTEAPRDAESLAVKRTFGGIENLMNTCYMASALQMLASLETFVQKLRETTPREDSILRRALLSLWDKLERGENVRPDEVKRIIDERSCLFEGYEQQDAHEFLTTLLDLLDEDYKKGMPPPTFSDSSNTDTVAEKQVITPKSESPEEWGDMDIDEEESLSCKRMKTEPSHATTPDSPDSSLDDTNHTGTFSELDVHQIEQLLHGSMPSSREGMVMPAPPTPINYRLVGGRMNPTETPFWTTHNAPTSIETTPNTEVREQAGSNSFEETMNSTIYNPAATMSNPNFEPKHSYTASPVDECFTTKTRVRLTCDSCKYTRTQEETYLHWSLEMSGDTTVDEVIRRFFASERRELKCEKCFGDSATQTRCITQLPRILLLHFKRFVVKVSEDYTSISYEKNSSSVAYCPTITPDDLKDYMAADCAVEAESRYNIRSVVNHHGSSVSFGHYTADANRIVEQDASRTWHRFNDSYVSKVSEQQAVQGSSRSAYLVMYELE